MCVEIDDEYEVFSCFDFLICDYLLVLFKNEGKGGCMHVNSCRVLFC